MEYVNSIEEDVKWLGFQWDNRLWASDYFDEMYDCALDHQERTAYVCDLSAVEIRAHIAARSRSREGKPVQPQRGRKLEIVRRNAGRQVRRRGEVTRAKIDISFSE